MEQSIPQCFYRVSVKALVLDETRIKFLVIQEKNGIWEFPGGGLEWGATPQNELTRELKEEMGVVTTSIAQHPSYFLTETNHRGHWIVNIFYETTLQTLDFTPSDECVATRFVTANEAKKLTPQLGNITKLAEQFDIERRQSHKL
jgi:8-oxo-dGTP diphosphatase